VAWGSGGWTEAVSEVEVGFGAADRKKSSLAGWVEMSVDTSIRFDESS
jgi:hypothetical protein